VKTNLNRPIGEITKDNLDKIKVICFDRDGVVAKKGTWWTNGKLETFHLVQSTKYKVQRLAERFLICITSGRSLEFLEQEWNETDISLHGEIGNFVKHKYVVTEEVWTASETETISRIKLKMEGLRDDKISGFEPKKKIITLHCKDRIMEVERIARDDLLYCWWNGEAYDIGPKRISKGTAIKKWVGGLGIGMDQVMTVGNGINDSNMTDIVGIDVSTNPERLEADFVVSGEELGAGKLIDRLLELVK